MYGNLSIYPQDAAFTDVRFFTAFLRIPPARPAAMRRAFLLEELSYPPVSDPLSSGLGLSPLSVVPFSPDFSCFQMVAPSRRNNPINQVFFNEAGVALDASRRMCSPSSAFGERKKKTVRMTNSRSDSVCSRYRHPLLPPPCQ